IGDSEVATPAAEDGECLTGDVVPDRAEHTPRVVRLADRARRLAHPDDGRWPSEAIPRGGISPNARARRKDTIATRLAVITAAATPSKSEVVRYAIRTGRTNRLSCGAEIARRRRATVSVTAAETP